MGDLNARVGKGAENQESTNWEREKEPDDQVVQLCYDHELCLTNTYYQLPPRGLITWTSPILKPKIELFIIFAKRD